MKFKYVGNPLDESDTHPAVEVFRLVFPLGQPIEVEDEHAISTLSENPQFEVCDGEIEVVEQQIKPRRGRKKKESL